jgi:hypothetical protein
MYFLIYWSILLHTDKGGCLVGCAMMMEVVSTSETLVNL